MKKSVLAIVVLALFAGCEGGGSDEWVIGTYHVSEQVSVVTACGGQVINRFSDNDVGFFSAYMDEKQLACYKENGTFTYIKPAEYFDVPSTT